MDPLSLGVRVAAAALLFSGLRKFPEPEPTCQALKVVGLPSRRPWVWGLAAVEVIVGLLALRQVGVATAAALGIFYLLLTVFLFGARRAGIGCGCFTGAARPPGWLHISLNLAAAIVSLSAAGLALLAS